MDGIFSRHLKSSSVHSDLLLINKPNPNAINNVLIIILIVLVYFYRLPMRVGLGTAIPLP